MMNKADEVKCKQVLYRMRQRCSDPNHETYKYYGGKGIRVCDEWQGRQGAKNFIAWAEANGYEVGLSIERINNDLNYEPSNCKWIELWQQQRNRQCNVLNEESIGKILYMKQQGYSVREIANHLDIKLSSVRGLFLYERRDVEAKPFDIGDVKRSVNCGARKRFTADDIKHIRESGLSNYTLADQYGVTHNTIHQIKHKMSYKNF